MKKSHQTPKAPAEGTASIRDEMLSNQRVIDELNARLNRKTEEVKIIQQISSGILATLDLSQIMNRILEATDTLLGFRHAMILLADEREETLQLVSSRGYDNAGIGAEVALGMGPLGMVAQKRRIMRIGNIQAMMHYHTAVRARMGAAPEVPNPAPRQAMPGLPGAQSQIGIPLVVQGRLVGVFAVESETPGAFDELDEMLLTIVANQVATAIANASLHEAERGRSQERARLNAELKRLNETLETKVAERTAELSRALEAVQREQTLAANLLTRMAPPEVISDVVNDRLMPRRLNITIMFTDMVNFTSYSSGLEPDELFAQLNDLFGWAGHITLRYRGYINKTIGDSIMALFGVPDGNSTHAIDAVLAALNMQLEMPHKSPLPMRIGINSGMVTVGMLGPTNKSLYDVLGDAVNVASRMEHLADSGGVAISKDTYNLVAPYFEIKPLGEFEIKGKGRMECFRVTGIKNLAKDDRRVDPSSVFARSFLSVIDEVYEFRRRHFSMIDFLSLQARDGALSHNEAVAAYALALLRHLKALEPPGIAALQEVSEEQVLALALLHDVGKHALTTKSLNTNYGDTAGRDRLRGELLTHTQSALARLGREELAPELEKLYRFEQSRGIDGQPNLLTEIVATADVYDALTAPKLYKGMPWRIRGALEELLRLPYCHDCTRPVFTSFVELMKPDGVHIAPRTTG
ncbi:MAG: GAF domain-containing protein, partial [Candidatus Lambdaproteobacteria bacterium]|nr:GAF domain-containing protein [Candidatus Lambdaproteobacteria bacterium]